MLTTALLVLGFFVILIFDNRPMIGAVLAGLLVIVWMLVQKIKVLKESTTSIEKSLATLTAVITKMEKAELSESMWQTKIVRKDADDTHVIKEDVPPPEKVDVITSSMHEDGPVAMQSSQTYSLAKELNNRTAPVIPEKSSKNDDVPNVVVSKAAPSTSTPSISIPPKGPSIIEKLLMFAWSWITDGNVFVRAGIIVLFMGMTFLIRYAIGENLIPIELRLVAVSAVAIALMYWGWCQRESRKTFSLVVQGGGVGLFYLTIFAGFSLYHVIPSGAAFVLLALTVALAAMLAVYQDAKSLALFATVGGFLAPVLTSSGSNNYIGLFSYYAILNLGIFTIAWFRSWKILNLVGFLFTFVISTTWGVLSYKAEYFSTTEPFLILFFLLYIGIGILYARDQAEFYKNYVDSTLIFGTPLLAFGLQCAMVKDYEYGIAISAFSLAFFYILLTNYLWKKYADSLRLLSESFLSLGVVFATLAIPFAIDG
ncbi:MAG: DUF2339 domain-containing protein, partial [Gammaproteobacteria bacterium]|nr:DUF2339 domain-containing protein [Gammaproteobacteria bacterium]